MNFILLFILNLILNINLLFWVLFSLSTLIVYRKDTRIVISSLINLIAYNSIYWINGSLTANCEYTALIMFVLLITLEICAIINLFYLTKRI